MPTQNFHICLLIINVVLVTVFLVYVVKSKKFQWQIFVYIASRVISVSSYILAILIATQQTQVSIYHARISLFVFSISLEIFSLISYDSKFRNNLFSIVLIFNMIFFTSYAVFNPHDFENFLLVGIAAIFGSFALAFYFFIFQNRNSRYHSLIGFSYLTLNLVLVAYLLLKLNLVTVPNWDNASASNILYLIAGISSSLTGGLGLIILLKEMDEKIIESRNENLKNISTQLQNKNLLLKAQNRKMRAKNSILQKLNSELDNFVYKVSHDLKAPVASSQGLIALAKMTQNSEELEQYMAMQEKALNKMNLFIKNVLQYAKNSRLKVVNEMVDLKSMVDETINRHPCQPDIKVSVVVKGSGKVFSDRQRLQFIIENLLSNAFKFSRTHIRVEIEKREKNTFLSFIDDGLGIDPQYHHQLFEMFGRYSATKSGSGLGLFIAKEAVSQLQGEIFLDSEYTSGTKFTVIINHNLELSDYRFNGKIPGKVVRADDLTIKGKNTVDNLRAV